MIELVRADFAAQCVPVNTQDLRRAGLIPLYTVQHPLDESFFKLPDCLIKQNSSLHHLAHESFELILHGTLPSETRDSA